MIQLDVHLDHLMDKNISKNQMVPLGSHVQEVVKILVIVDGMGC
jgi:hypothetical protein